MPMSVVDMHGVRHELVENIMIDACSKYDIPFIVITGNSLKMKNLVAAAVKQFDLSARDLINNPGRMLIDETG